MNRRSFIQTLVGGVVATAAIRTYPFRVFSFPSEIKVIGEREFEEAYITGNSGKFAELLAPGLRQEFINWFKSTNPDEYAYGNDVIQLAYTYTLSKEMRQSITAPL